MANTFSPIYTQVVFAVKYRECLIHSSWEDELYKYIIGIVQKKEQKMLAINGIEDQIHLLIGLKPNCNLYDWVREIKKSLTEFIKDNKFTSKPFKLQECFGAFSYSHSGFSNVIRYIQNQKEHHHKQTFKDEYLELLSKFEVEYKKEYLFDWL